MRRYLILPLILLTLTACGKKGPVRPLELPLPAAPAAFDVRQTGNQLLLSWTIPAANQDGTPLADLAGFKIFRMRSLPGEECPECEPNVLWREANLDYLQEARRLGDRLFLSDTEVEQGYIYRYRILPVTIRGRGGAPATAGRAFRIPPGSPQHLVAAGHDRMVRISWESPADSPDEIAGYNVYRRTEGDPPPLLPVNSALVEHNFYEDYGLENGRTYLYTVRAVTGKGAEATEGAPSETASAAPAPGS